MKQKITSRPGLFGSTNHYDQKGHKIGSSRQGIFGSTTHYDAKGHNVGSSWNSPTRSDHYDAGPPGGVQLARDLFLRPL